MKAWNIKKQDYPQYQDKSSLWIIDEISKYPFRAKEITEDWKTVLSNNFLWWEKHFFSTVLTPSEQIDYILWDEKNREKLQSTNIRNISLESFQGKHGQVRITDEKISWWVNKPNLNPETLIEWKETEIVGHKVIKQWDYYLIDGKPSDGTIFIKDADGKLTKKTLKSDNTDFDSQDVMLTPNESITTLYPINSQALAQGKEDIFRYYALESSGDDKNPNLIDGLLNINPRPEWLDKAIVEMKKKLTWLDSTKRTKEEIQKIFQEWYDTMKWIDAWNQQRSFYQTALEKWAKSVSVVINPVV